MKGLVIDNQLYHLITRNKKMTLFVKKNNKQMKLLITILFAAITLLSCKRSEEEILASAEKTLLRFMDELKLQNFKSAEVIYPELTELSSYRTFTDFLINRSEVKDTTVVFFGEYKSPVRNETHPIQFTLQEQELDRWIIINSKGLSPAIYQDIFSVAKRSGCLKNIESDVQIERDCKFLEQNIQNRVNELKEHIESNINFEKKGSNLSRSYGMISGEVTIQNNTIFTIPSFGYSLFITYFDRNKNLVHAEEVSLAYESISPNSLKQYSIYASSTSREYNSYSTFVKLKDDSFIRRYVVENEKISCY